LQNITRGIRREPVHLIPDLTIPDDYIDYEDTAQASVQVERLNDDGLGEFNDENDDDFGQFNDENDYDFGELNENESSSDSLGLEFHFDYSV